MPTNQTKVLNDTEIGISQALPNRGGSVLYTGMNSKGEYFIGKKKFNASTGEEIQTPITTAIISDFDTLTVNNLIVNTKIDASTAIENVKTLSVSGATTLSSTLSVSGATTLSSTLGVTGNTSIGGTFGVTGNTSIGGTLSVSGATTLSSTLGVTGAVTISNSTQSTSKTTGALIVTGGVGIGSNLNVGAALSVTGDITAFYTSDQRLKDNIVPIPNALNKVLSISGNTFDWNKKSGKEGKEAGVIAQEILEVLPEVVTTRDNGYLAVNYEKLVPLLIEAIKELKAEVEELKGGK